MQIAQVPCGLQLIHALRHTRRINVCNVDWKQTISRWKETTCVRRNVSADDVCGICCNRGGVAGFASSLPVLLDVCRRADSVRVCAAFPGAGASASVLRPASSGAVETAAGKSRSPPARTARPGGLRRPGRRRVRSRCPQPAVRWAAIVALRTRGNSPRRWTSRFSSGEFIRSCGGTARCRFRFPMGIIRSWCGLGGPGGVRRPRTGAPQSGLRRRSDVLTLRACRARAREVTRGTRSRHDVRPAREQPVYLLPNPSRTDDVTYLAHFSHLRRGKEAAGEPGIFPIHTAHDGWARRQAQRAPRGGRTTPTQCSRR
jgi:hypothetical protein